MSRRALGDVARFVNGAAFKPDDWEAGGLPIIRIQNLTGTGEKFNYTKRRVKPELVIEPGDLLVSWSATLDVYRWSGPRGLLNQHIFKVFPNSDIDADYLFFALKSVLAELSSKTHGSTMKHIVRGDFESTRIYVPAIPEQSRIVDLLSRAEGIVHLCREAQRKSTELVPALFLNMFGDPASNPKGWQTIPFGELVENKDGRRRPIKSADRDNRQGPYPYYGASGIIDYMDEYIFDEMNLLIAEDGANLVSRSTPIAFIAEGKYWVNNHAHVVGTTAHADLSFLSWQMNLRDLRDFITGSAQPKLNQSNLNKIPMIAPPMELQRQFAAKADAVRGIAAQQAAALATAQATFEALLHRSFSVS